MKAIVVFNQLLAFLLELAMLFVFGYWGYGQGNSEMVRWVSALGCVAGAVILWSLFAAPRSSRRLQVPWLIAFKFCLFSLCSVALHGTGWQTMSIVFTLLFVVSGLIEVFAGKA